MSHAWKQWEGQVANGEFPLLRYLGGSEHSAVFLTEFHEGERLLKAAIKLIPAPQENGEFQLSRWRLAKPERCSIPSWTSSPNFTAKGSCMATSSRSTSWPMVTN